LNEFDPLDVLDQKRLRLGRGQEQHSGTAGRVGGVVHRVPDGLGVSLDGGVGGLRGHGQVRNGLDRRTRSHPFKGKEHQSSPYGLLELDELTLLELDELTLLLELLLFELLLVTLLLELLLLELLLVTLLLELLLVTLLDEDELTLDELEELTLLLELDDDKSSIDRICSRSPDFGPGNCNDPVWKFSTSAALSSPDVLVSVRTACQIRLSVSSTVTTSVVPARSVS